MSMHQRIVSTTHFVHLTILRALLCLIFAFLFLSVTQHVMSFELRFSEFQPCKAFLPKMLLLFLIYKQANSKAVHCTLFSAVTIYISLFNTV